MDLNHIYHPLNVIERNMSKAKAMSEVYLSYGISHVADFWKKHYESLKEELAELKKKYES